MRHLRWEWGAHRMMFQLFRSYGCSRWVSTWRAAMLFAGIGPQRIYP